MTRFYSSDNYRAMFGNQYIAYLWDSYRKLQKLIPDNVKTILSIGCGTGEIEELMPYDFALYDPFGPIVEYRQKPTGQYDYAIAQGCVISAAKPDEKVSVIKLALEHAPKFLIDTDCINSSHSDKCMSYYEWDEEVLLENYNWRRVDKNYIEVCRV